jgi:hypothetical protein
MPNKRIRPDSDEGHSILGSLTEIEHFAATIEGEAKTIQEELKQIRNEIQGMDMDDSLDNYDNEGTKPSGLAPTHKKDKETQDRQSDAGSLFF